MMTIILRLTALALLLSLLPQPVRAASPAEVDQAIARAKAHLYAQQRNGTWEIENQGDYAPGARHSGGLTAVATYALVAAGEDPQSPKLTKAIDFLKTADIKSVYALGCRTQLWALLPPTRETRALAKADADRIIKQIKSAGDARGLFYYPGTPQDQYDVSISQYGVLGLWACERAGAEIPGAVWQAMDRAWRAQQFADGGWAYRRTGGTGEDKSESSSVPSMTTAGIATLFITHDAVRARDYLNCAGNRNDPNIDKGVEWLTKHFNDVYTGGARGPGVALYTLYGVERIGVAGGYKYFGKHDWFREGADFLVKSQDKGGHWGQPGDVFGHNPANIPTTSFGLLFLARGQSPVLINKLRHDPTAKTAKPSWNQRPRDAANLVDWLGRSIERPLNWQITTLDAPADELLDAPVLYLTGTHALEFNDDQRAKLRQFVEDGGLILGNADCNSPHFAKSFTELGQKLFTDYEFRELPEDHPIHTRQQYPRATFKSKPSIVGLSNGTRELMLLLNADPSRAWQTPFDGRLEPYAVGGNILLYAVDKKGLRNRNVTYTIRPNPDAKTDKAVKLARLSYPGNWNPEPGGWRRVAALLRNHHKIDLQPETVALGGGKLSEPPPAAPKIDPKELRARATKRLPQDQVGAAIAAGDTAKIETLVQAEVKKLEAEMAAQAAATKGRTSKYAIAHLTGSARISLSPAQLKELKDFVAGGGTLLIDSAGGSTEFAESVEPALATFAPLDTEGGATLKHPLPPEHPLLRDVAAIAQKDGLYRDFARKRLGAAKAPRLRALYVNNRPGVVYSPEDLSTGLVGHDVDGIAGYTPAIATTITRNVLLEASK
jgi:hypothetical protein